MTDLEKLIRGNLGRQPGDFMFGNKGNRISKLLLEKKGIEGQKYIYKWLPVQWSCWLAESGEFVELTIREFYDGILEDVNFKYQIKAIKNLRRLLKKFPFLVDPSVTKIFESHPLKNENTNKILVFDEILAQCADKLQIKYTEISGKNPLKDPEVWPYGGLLFFSDLPFGRSIVRKGGSKKQSLLFHLVYHFRNITSNNREALESPGGTMPKFGKPCYSLVAEIAQIVLEVDIDEDSVKKIIGRLVKRDAMYFDPSFSEYRVHPFYSYCFIPPSKRGA